MNSNETSKKEKLVGVSEALEILKNSLSSVSGGVGLGEEERRNREDDEGQDLERRKRVSVVREEEEWRNLPERWQRRPIRGSIGGNRLVGRRSKR